MKLSIITINLNNTDGLEKTIQSVICQKYTDYEYIIIDGNSTDNSVEIIKKHSDHIHYWISEPDTGIYNAMNKGIKKANGEYIIFMNSGDCFINSDTLLNVFSKEHTADLIVGSIIKNWKRWKERKSFPDKITLYNILKTGNIPHQSTFVKKYLFDKLGYYDESKLSADWIFAFLAIFKYGKSVEKLNEDIALMDISGICHTQEGTIRMRRETQEAVIANFPYFYEDYKELCRFKQYTFTNLKRHIKWRIQNFIHK
jgi:glycosyltransferase involved in cell wall biosynthesis